MSEERTEAATPRKRQKAREQGQVARSNELVGATVLLGTLAALPTILPTLSHKLGDLGGAMIRQAATKDPTPQLLEHLVLDCLQQLGAMVVPVLGVIAGGAAASNIAQVGFSFNPTLLNPKFNRLNPIAGLGRLVNPRSWFELAKGFLKVAIVGLAGWRFLSDHREEIFRLAQTEPAKVAAAVGELAHGMGMRMAGALAVLAALDYGYQRWQLERQLRMTKQELKDEFREQEGRPEVRGRIRSRQRDLSRRRMMSRVPMAAVVITNPTHFAVALAYEMGKGGAPKVVAKGQDLIAQRIIEIAREHRVPCVQNPPLARSLHKLVEVEQEIPPALYRAVAEVLALVWRADRRLSA